MCASVYNIVETFVTGYSCLNWRCILPREMRWCQYVFLYQGRKLWSQQSMSVTWMQTINPHIYILPWNTVDSRYVDYEGVKQLTSTVPDLGSSFTQYLPSQNSTLSVVDERQIYKWPSREVKIYKETRLTRPILAWYGDDIWLISQLWTFFSNDSDAQEKIPKATKILWISPMNAFKQLK